MDDNREPQEAADGLTGDNGPRPEAVDVSNVALPACTLLIETAAKLNLASHQCSWAFLRDLRIANGDEEKSLEQVTVTMRSNPAFLTPKTWTVDRIGPGELLPIKNRDLDLDAGFLLGLTDAVRGTVQFTVECGGSVLAEESRPVELLAWNEWGGAGFMPELLAAFSLPNDPAVDKILREASLILRAAGKSDEINGYTSKSRQRVWDIASAIYAAIGRLGLSYTVPPASFERDGQKIRLPGQILENRLGTCLDTTMLFASAFEQAGLNPIVALPRGHAFVGVWLQPEDLSSIVIDEAEILRKRAKLNELLLIETTCVTGKTPLAFSQAVATAQDSIVPEKDGTFLAAIDIRRARAHRIVPLGVGLSRPSSASAAPSAVDAPRTGPDPATVFEEAPPLPDFTEGLEEERPPDTPAGRLERWQRKLLDLSARNPLLNHRSERSGLRLVCPEPGLLEDRLADGDRISIVPVPRLSGAGQDEELHQQRTGEKISLEYAREALGRKQVLVDLPEEELTRRAVDLYRKAQTAFQEGGSNTLFLALGFLLWRRNDRDDRRFRAPLILLPVSLERKSVRSGIRMTAHDDEPRFNTTLLEMLRKDFKVEIRGLDGALPTDERGIDVNGILDTIRKAVKDVSGFEVLEDVVLGHFSFAKFLMWKDLVDRTEDLRRNPIVKHLLDTPRAPFPSTVAFVDGSTIDREFKPSDLLTPLPADASQMSAIATADRGKDFVIIGPPGTGKSQTISNLIAHFLGKGKTVLFVSEKTAALEVVYRRLRDVGLDRFCLELHSNKARKADVLGQLRQAWEFRQTGAVGGWEKESERLRGLRDRLNTLVDRLHLRRKNGLTVHHAIGVKIRDSERAKRVTFSWASADAHDEAQLTAMREVAEQLRVAAAEVGALAGSPFRLVAWGDWSPQWEGKLVDAAGRLSAASAALETMVGKLLGLLSIEVPRMTSERLEVLVGLASALAESHGRQTAFALEAAAPERLAALDEAVRRLQTSAGARAGLSCPYAADAWKKIDGNEIAKRWKEANERWWPMNWFARNAVIKELQAGGAEGNPDPAVDAPLLVKLREEGEGIDRLDSRLEGVRDWKSQTSDPEALRTLTALGSRLRESVGRLADDPAGLVTIREKLTALLSHGNDLLAPTAVIGQAIREFLGASTAFHEAVATFDALTGTSIRTAFSSSERALAGMRETADQISARHAELHPWCGWARRRREAQALELGPLIEAIEVGRVPLDEIEATFEAAYCTWWSGAVIGEDPVLKTFSTAEHLSAIGKFREADMRFMQLTSEFIRAELARKRPNPEDIKRKTSWGVLQHEIQKKTRHKPIRQLVQEIPDVLTTLTPCLMMSPLSVAQYLPANQTLFDVVIFDEASQITVWDAVGTLARARQAIVAGDPKQMPPTNFFARANDDDDDEIDQEGDLESILDEMLGASIPQRTLNLHYRSRRESLIAFSNSRYYDNQLITFPAPIHPDRGVRLVRPTGFYSRGKGRNNLGEARAIVEEILQRLTNASDEVRKKSIGVVTFNSEQQTLIENLLDEARSRNPEIEWAFSSETTLEPVFVKNLETVQGDERDVILFSVTYGPDEGNHVTMNFGPLNRSGGERRLNVAMTRARSEMLVFSTLSPDRIDLSRTQARAVMDLKHFLEYAERGPTVLGSAIRGSEGDCESPFEAAVAEALREKGWTVRPQVGVSAYRIDLGVVHPDAVGVFLAGVECDGAMYHSSTYARERDKIRQTVLEGLGWSLFRVWSTEWWVNRSKALDTLHEALTKLLERDRAHRKEAAAAVSLNGDGNVALGQLPGSSASTSLQQAGTEAMGSTAAPARPVAASGPSAGPAGACSDASKGQANGPCDPVSKDLAPGNSVTRETSSNDAGSKGSGPYDPAFYVVATLDDERFKADPDRFYTREYEPHLTCMVEHVIATEGPIHEEVLVRRIARHHGFQRAGRQIRDIVVEVARRCGDSTEEPVGLFFRPRRNGDSPPVPARFKGRDEELRKAEYICRDEIRAIAAALMPQGMPDPLEIGRRLGITRLSQTARKRFEESLGVNPMVPGVSEQTPG